VGSGKESHAISFDEGLSVLGQTVEKGFEVAGEDTETDKGVDYRGKEAVKRISTVNELVLVSIDGSVFTKKDLKTDLLKVVDHFLGVDGGHCSNEGFHTVHDINMTHIGGIIVLQTEPIEEGHLGSGLEDTVEFFEESFTILGIGENLDLVETIKVLVLEGEGVVVVGNLEGKAVSVTGLLGISLSDFDLVLVNVDTSHLSTSNGTNVMGDTTTTTPDIKNMGIGLKVQITGHLPFEKNLVLENRAVQIHDGRNVHLLDLTNGTQLVDDGIVVLNVPLVSDRVANSFLIEKLIGLHKRVNGGLGKEVEGFQGEARGGDAVPGPGQVGHNGAEEDKKDEADEESSSHDERIHFHD